MHGLGNDFVVVDHDAVPAGAVLDELARRVCDRHRGVGADGLLVVGPREPDGAWRIAIRNADGSRASACGTGACAVVAAARVEGWFSHPNASASAAALEPGVGDDVTVRLPGGSLRLSLGDDSIVLRGLAEEVFRGEWIS